MIRVIIGIVLGAAVIVFALQNAETVTYTFIAWSLSAPRAVVVLLAFVLGLVTGWLETGLGRLRRRAR